MKRFRTTTTMPFGVMFRVFVLGAVSVLAAGYALFRHYAIPRPPMRAPIAVDSADIPAPDVIEVAP